MASHLLTLADIDVDGAAATVQAAADSAQQVADAAAPAATANGGGGFFGPLASGLEAILKVIDGGLIQLGVPYSYGFSIILLTVMVKAAIFPLSKQQVRRGPVPAGSTAGSCMGTCNPYPFHLTAWTYNGAAWLSFRTFSAPENGR